MTTSILVIKAIVIKAETVLNAKVGVLLANCCNASFWICFPMRA